MCLKSPARKILSIRWAVRAAIIIVIVLVILAVLQIRFAATSLDNFAEELTADYQQEVADNIAAVYRGALDYNGKRLIEIASKPAFVNNITSYQKSVIFSYKNTEPLLKDLFVINSEGFITSGTSDELSRYSTESCSDKPYFYIPFAQGEIYYGQLVFQEKEDISYYYISVPITSESGEKTGVLLGLFLLDDIINMVKYYELTKGTYVELTDSSGTVIVRSKVDLTSFKDNLPIKYSEHSYMQSFVESNTGNFNNTYDYFNEDCLENTASLEPADLIVKVKTPLEIIRYKGYETKRIHTVFTAVTIGLALICLLGFMYWEGNRSKKIEDDLKYLSYHDSLTGLYNRSYFEEGLKRIDTPRQLPIGIIIGDLNSLKLINDCLGHSTGDRLLVAAAEVLKNACRKEDIIARYGGDEFSIILPGVSSKDLVKIKERIMNLCTAKSIEYELPISIALGISLKETKNKDIKDAVREAEDKMYTAKVYDKKDTFKDAVFLLEKIVEKKDNIYKGHNKRVKKLSLKLGKMLKINEYNLAKLSKLAGFHDIGKIAVSETILKKTRRLTKKERLVMRQHVEVGYRIAESSEYLHTMAEDILHHHEMWDGSGYPVGLKKGKIPILSRIIAVVDAYDVMTHDTPYKKAVSREEAIEELKKNSGTQFDPEIANAFIKMISDQQVKK